MPAQEGQLRLDGLLVPVHERCVVPAGHPEDLCTWRLLSSMNRLRSRIGLILVAREDEQRAPHAGGVAARPVEHKGQSRARSNLLLPLRVLVARVERSVTVEAVRRCEEGDGPRLARERHQQRLQADETAEGIEDAPAGEAQHRERLLVARSVLRANHAISERRLRDRCAELRVVRRDAKHMTARGREAPDREPGRVDSRLGSVG